MSLNISQYEIQSILNMLNDLDESFWNLNDDEWLISNIESRLPCGYTCDAGASKLVIIPSDKPYVIKVPFTYNQDMYYDCYDSDEDEEYYDENTPEFSCAVYPISGGTGSDYCKSEAEYYEVAQNYGVADMLAETRYIGDANGAPIYVQEKCIGWNYADGVEISDEVRESYERKVSTLDGAKTHDYARYGVEMDKDFEMRVLQSYSMDKLLQLFDFIREEHLGDFHTGNIGFFSANNKPCIFDYSGYWE